MMSTLQKGFVLCFLSALLFTCKTFAVVETYSQYKTALQIGTDLPNKDEKFKSQFVWQNILSSSVEDAVTLRILDRNILSQDFSCTVTLRIEYFKTPEQSSPDVIEPVQLSLEYKTATGALQKLNDTYTFKDAYQVRIIVTDITSPQYGANIPSFIELGSIINVNRTYKFQEGFPINITADLSGTSNSNTVRELGLGWDFIPGAEEYDLEWATIDEGSERQAILNRMVAKKLSTDPEPEPAELESVFRNNATRVTTHNNKYPVSLILNSRYMAVRIRPAFFNSEGIREEGQWRYKKADDIQFAVWDLQSAVDQQDLTWHEQKLNWQYAATYAEEGKKKEVINYFDGTLRGRQTATINSTDNVAVVQENVYDQYGRPLISILPAPVKENSSGPEYLHFFKDFNKNTSGIAYSFKDILNGCEIKPSALSTDVDFTKASNTYYSPNNIFIKEGSPFKRDVRHDQFIPNADGFPFSVTQYTPDNTGRIRLQGGVGATFQPGLANSKTTKYYYSKPTQWELDRLFGNDVGFANHYLKNMVVDPNGQISVSYLNASGKTIATALAGNAPLSQDALSTATATEQTINLIRPEQFTFDATALTLSATTTHITTVPGKVELKYNIEKLLATYTEGTFNLCKECYYDLSVLIKDDCGKKVYPIGDTPFTPFKIGTETNVVLNPDFDKVGEYYINFEFKLSKKGIEAYADQFITDGQLDGAVKKEIDFIKKYLDQLKLAYFGGCQRCAEALGTEEDFVDMFKQKLLDLNVSATEVNNLDLFIKGKYQALSTECTLLQENCPQVSPCQKYVATMLEHVSPNGQFALFDKDGWVLEPNDNILSKYWTFIFPSNTQAPESELIILDDGTTTSPYSTDFYLKDGQFNVKKIIEYWKEEWAERFLVYHPEYCKLKFCQDSEKAIAWDYKVKEEINTITETATLGDIGAYAHGDDPIWLVKVDPFFKEKESSDPLYVHQAEIDGLRTRFEYALNNYSRSMLGVSDPALENKNLPKFVDYVLYCIDATGNTNSMNSIAWNSCSPVSSCRIADREWQDYRDAYFELKEKYYQIFRNEVEDYCGGKCEVGTRPGLADLNKPTSREFYISVVKEPACTTNNQRIKVTYLAGKLKKTITLQIYYPGQSDVLEVQMNENESETTVCVPGNLPVSTIKINAVIQ